MKRRGFLGLLGLGAIAPTLSRLVTAESKPVEVEVSAIVETTESSKKTTYVWKVSPIPNNKRVRGLANDNDGHPTPHGHDLEDIFSFKSTISAHSSAWKNLTVIADSEEKAIEEAMRRGWIADTFTVHKESLMTYNPFPGVTI